MNHASLNMQKMSIDKLLECKAPYNPRTINAEEKNGLRYSMERFGYVQNIIYNKQTKVVVSGHQRLEILSEEGYDSADVHVVDLSQENEKKLNVIMNSATITGDFTFDINEMLKDILDDDPELFDMTSLSKLNIFEETEAIIEDENETDEIIEGMKLMPYESYDAILVVCKRRDDFMFLSSKLGLGEKVIISSSSVQNKKLGFTRAVDAKDLIDSFDKDYEQESDEEFNL